MTKRKMIEEGYYWARISPSNPWEIIYYRNNGEEADECWRQVSSPWPPELLEICPDRIAPPHEDNNGFEVLRAAITKAERRDSDA